MVITTGRFPRCRLRLYRGHEKACPHRRKKRGINSCKCTWWVDGVIRGRRVNKSLGTRNKSVADELVLYLELKSQAPQCTLVTPNLAEACDRFLDQKKAQHLSETSLSKYRLLFERLTEFARQQNLVELTDVSPDVLNRF
jgi:hypothetical protein